MIRRYIIALALAWSIPLLWNAPAFALDVPSAPPLNRPVVDMAHILSSGDIDTITATINQTRAQKDYQIGILIIPTLGADEYLEGYSLKVARAWGAGTAEKDNGVLLLVVTDEHKVRIEVGRGLEGDLTDVESSRIIRNVIAPEFRNGQYSTGIQKAVTSITSQVEGKADPASEVSATSQSTKFDWTWIFFFGFWILPWLGAVLARSRSWWAGGLIGAGIGFGFAALIGWAMWAVIAASALSLFGFIFDYVVSKNFKSAVNTGSNPAWWAGGTYWGGGSGGDSGGFGGGFGGGGFGGGGASGDW